MARKINCRGGSIPHIVGLNATRGSDVEPATRQDIKDAIGELKLFVVERENAWLKWVLGIQITYFVITITVAFVAAHIK
jgi:hypothetical protein